MTWTDALESLASHPHLWRFRQLCAEDNRDTTQRDKYRGLVIRLASGTMPVYPPVATQVGNALGAVTRFVTSGFAVVDQAEFDRRRAICATCDFLDAAQDRCLKCACYLAVKPWGKAESCPVGKW